MIIIVVMMALTMMNALTTINSVLFRIRSECLKLFLLWITIRFASRKYSSSVRPNRQHLLLLVNIVPTRSPPVVGVLLCWRSSPSRSGGCDVFDPEEKKLCEEKCWIEKMLSLSSRIGTDIILLEILSKQFGLKCIVWKLRKKIPMTSLECSIFRWRNGPLSKIGRASCRERV